MNKTDFLNDLRDRPSGKIRLPDERSGGRCEVRTSTGDIEFRILP